MTEQKLNGPQIGAGFEKMDGECVTQRMRGVGFGETGQTMRLPAGRLYARIHTATNSVTEPLGHFTEGFLLWRLY